VCRVVEARVRFSVQPLPSVAAAAFDAAFDAGRWRRLTADQRTYKICIGEFLLRSLLTGRVALQVSSAADARALPRTQVFRSVAFLRRQMQVLFVPKGPAAAAFDADTRARGKKRTGTLQVAYSWTRAVAGRPHRVAGAVVHRPRLRPDSKAHYCHQQQRHFLLGHTTPSCHLFFLRGSSLNDNNNINDLFL